MSVGSSPRIARGVVAHDTEIGADERGEVRLVDHEEIGGGDAGPALARDLVAAGDVEDEDLTVDESTAEDRREVVAAALEQHEIEGSRLASRSSTASRFAAMSSRIAVCGQHPVSTARMRASGSTALRRRKSASSVV